MMLISTSKLLNANSQSNKTQRQDKFKIRHNKRLFGFNNCAYVRAKEHLMTSFVCKDINFSVCIFLKSNGSFKYLIL